jgi:hypothetical protein
VLIGRRRPRGSVSPSRLRTAVRARPAARLWPALILALSAGSVGFPAAVAADGPVSTFYATGGNFSLMSNNTDVLTAPTWQFIQPLNSPVDLSVVMFTLRNPDDSSMWWHMTFAAPQGTPLAAGTYEKVGKAAFRPAGTSGFDVSRRSSGCSKPETTFTIHALERDESGTATTFSATFDTSCATLLTQGTVAHGEINIGTTRSWAQWSAAETNLQFGSIVVGQSGPSQSVTMTNLGTLPVTIAATINSTNPGDFHIVDTAGCLDHALGVASSCSIGLAFAPSVRSARAATLWLSSDGFMSVRSVELGGNGLDSTNVSQTVPATASYPLPFSVSGVVAGGDDRGSINWEVGGQPYASRSLYQWAADSIMVLAPGVHQVIAHYLGDSVSAQSYSDPATINVNLATEAFLEAYPRTVTVGQPTRLFATIEPPGATDLSGGTLSIVNLQTGATLVSTPVFGRRTELRADFTPPNSDAPFTFEARYSGHGLFVPKSRQITIEAVKTPTTISMTAPANARYPGPYVLSATVSPVPPGGSVYFTTDDPTLAWLGITPVDTVTGVATISANLLPGTRRIFATYTGTPVYASSGTGAMSTITVGTFLTVSASPNSGPEGTAVTISGVVRAIGAGDPAAGSLVITDADTNAFIASAGVTGTNHTVSAIVQPSQGMRQYRVSYSGSGDYEPTSTIIGVTIGPPNTDNTPPAGSIVIDGGQSFTNNANVALSISATDPLPGTGVTEMQLTDHGSWDTPWQPYVTQLAYALPGADGAKQLAIRFRDAAGNMSLGSSAGIVLDRTSPAAQPPFAGVLPDATVAKTTIPMFINFATTDPLSGVVAYGLGQSNNGGSSFTNVSVSGTTGQTVLSIAPGSAVYRFRSNATDAAGNTSSWVVGSPVTVGVTQDASTAVRYIGKWKAASSSKALGGKLRQSSAASARASMTFTGRQIALIAKQSSAGGRLDIYIDGTFDRTVDLYAAATSWRKVVYVANVASGQHVIEIRRSSSQRSATATVNVDAFLVLK